MQPDDEDDGGGREVEERAGKKQTTKVSFWTLLKNPMMAVLCFSRIADPMATTSIFSYLLFQLRYLSPDASDAIIATQAGILIGAKTFAKVCTGVFWGMLADSRGRKPVMLVGLLSSCLACIGYGFSTTFPMAIFWQVVQGAMSSNVAMARTVVAEIYSDSDQKVRSRALLLLQLTSSIGMLFGPLVGGFASHREGLGKLSDYPYALPNLIIGGLYGLSVIGVSFVVDETLEMRGNPRPGASNSGIWKAARRFWRREPAYKPVADTEEDSVPLTSSAQSSDDAAEDKNKQPQRLPFRQIWTPQVIATMISHFIISGHITTFATVWAVFLSTPVSAPTPDSEVQPRDEQGPSHALLFGGGVGFEPPEIGTLTTCATVLGVALQVLLLPRLTERLGTVRVWRMALWLFPFAYFLAPFPAMVASAHYRPSTAGDAEHASSTAPAAWAAISAVMILFMTARTGAQPPMVILINECVPHSSSRGTVNTIGTSVANLSRSMFPVAIMAVYGVGLRNGFVAAAFWLLSILAVVAIVASRWVAKGLDEGVVLKKRRGEANEDSV